MIETWPLIGRMVSKKNRCPRKDCGQHMEPVPMEHVVLWRCGCGYEVREVTGESKARWHEAQQASARLRR